MCDGFICEPGFRDSADIIIGAPLVLVVFLVCAFSLQTSRGWKCSNTNRAIGVATKPLPVEQGGGFILTQSFLL